jgi:hypothetical protein
MYPRITVTQLQLRNAMSDLQLYSQWDSNFRNIADEKAQIYWMWSPTLDSDSPFLTDDNTTIPEALRYSAFQLAQTL